MARSNVVPVRFSDEEVALIDARRGPLSRSDWLRVAMRVVERQNITYENFASWVSDTH